MPKLPSKIEQPVITCKAVLLVEGDDEANFFEELLKDMGMTPDIDVQTRILYGKENYRNEFPAFLNDPGFSTVNSYALIRDADTNAQTALESVQKLLKDYNQPYPLQHAHIAHNSSNRLKVGIFIMPGNSEKGMLEDLCLQSVIDHSIMPDVEHFMTQVKTKMQEKAPRNESKAKMQAFLAGMCKTVPRLGIAAKNKYWSFEHEAFSSIRHFIEELVLP